MEASAERLASTNGVEQVAPNAHLGSAAQATLEVTVAPNAQAAAQAAPEVSAEQREGNAEFVRDANRIRIDSTPLSEREGYQNGLLL